MEELTQLSDEIATQRDNLSHQKEVIEQQNILLAKSKSELEMLVTERTRELSIANRELVNQNVQLEQFAFMTAHNMRAPVAQLIGLTHIFDKTNPEFNLEVIRRIKESSLNLDEVIHDITLILQVKKGLDQISKKVNLSVIPGQVLDSYKREIELKKIKVVNYVEPSLQLYLIESYIHSVFSNIISNSIKYSDNRKHSQIEIQSIEDETSIKLIFADNGLGFDLQHNKEKLFKPFSRFNPDAQGKGLGLYLMKIEMDAMRGEIKIESKENIGTTVTLVFQKNLQNPPLNHIPTNNF